MVAGAANRFLYGVFRGPKAIGRLLVGETGSRICAVSFVAEVGPQAAASRAAAREGCSGAERGATSLLESAFSQLDEYFSGSRRFFTLPLALSGSEFDLLAWEILLRIPYGSTMSYAEQAGRMGRKGAARAVGGANGRNPAAIVVPCHRVIGSDGALTGFGPGIGKKKWLLDHERKSHGVRP